MYFQRISSKGTAPRYFESPTNFAQLKDSFGKVFLTWRAKRESLGPAFYLYLGTRRGMQVYAEHRYIMLIGGIEAFHRRKHGPTKSSKTEQRVPLRQMIFEILKEIPLTLEENRLRRFAAACAKARNDISHPGGQRDQSSAYDEFTSALHRKSEALAYLYHILILHEIGVDDTILRSWANEGFQSARIKSALMEACLIERSTAAAFQQIHL
jgi:hypothetical protein